MQRIILLTEILNNFLHIPLSSHCLHSIKKKIYTLKKKKKKTRKDKFKGGNSPRCEKSGKNVLVRKKATRHREYCASLNSIYI